MKVDDKICMNENKEIKIEYYLDLDCKNKKDIIQLKSLINN